jgi:hypothetical protein
MQSLDAQGDDVEFYKKHTFALDYLFFIPVKRNQLACNLSQLLYCSPFILVKSEGYTFKHMMRAQNITSTKRSYFTNLRCMLKVKRIQEELCITYCGVCSEI